MNNQLTSLATSTLSMSTVEIAELTGKLHAHVLRDFREVCQTLEIDQTVDFHLELTPSLHPNLTPPKAV